MHKAKQKTVDRNRPVTEEHWNAILAIPWNQENRALLERIREAGPEGLSYKAAGEHLYVRYQSINAVLRGLAFDFRLAPAKRLSPANFADESWTLLHAS